MWLLELLGVSDADVAAFELIVNILKLLLQLLTG